MAIRVCTLCSGYDSQMMAMKRLERDFGIESELVAWSEIDNNAIKAHNALFPEASNKNLGDMTIIDWSKAPDFDLLTYSTPCTSISAQGRQEGLEKGSGTESSIIWYTEQCIKEKRPKYLLLENVKQLASKRYEKDFKMWLDLLESYGYRNYYKVLNSLDFNVPQNRERLFVVSILNGSENDFTFPEAIGLKVFAKDLLEPFDCKWLYNNDFLQNLKLYNEPKISQKGFKVIGNVFKSGHGCGRIFDVTECDSTVSTCMMNHGTSIPLYRFDDNGNMVIAKMTPREMFRFMDVDTEYVDKIEKVCGSSGLLKMAGNSIVVSVLYHIFKQMFVK